jgi:hypothetical protein
MGVNGEFEMRNARCEKESSHPEAFFGISNLEFRIDQRKKP